VWTRFHPIAYAVQDIIHSGKLGKVKRFSSEFSMDFDPDSGLGVMPRLYMHIEDFADSRRPALQPQDD
jgi:predicted dehydrogenase